jgi:hypothetical protein
MKNGIIIAIVAVLVGGVVGYFIFSSQTLGATGGKPIAVKYNFTQGMMTNGIIVGGDVVEKTVTTTLTADEICNGSVINGTGSIVQGPPTYTFPTFALLAAKCLTQNGDTKSILIYNSSTSTATTVAAGSGGTLISTDSGGAVAASKAATLTIIRTSASAYKILMTYHDN